MREPSSASRTIPQRDSHLYHKSLCLTSKTGIVWGDIAQAGVLHGPLLLSDSPLSVFKDNLAGRLCLLTNKDIEKINL